MNSIPKGMVPVEELRQAEKQGEFYRQETHRWKDALKSSEERVSDLESLVHSLETTRKDHGATLDTLRAERDRLLEEIDEWKAASGLEVNGDPEGITPEECAKNVQALYLENDRLREALEWIAKPDATATDALKYGILAEQKARAALAAGQGEGEICSTCGEHAGDCSLESALHSMWVKPTAPEPE